LRSGVSSRVSAARHSPAGRLRRVAGQFRPVQAQLPEKHHAFGSEQPQQLAEQATLAKQVVEGGTSKADYRGRRLTTRRGGDRRR
jgi:hypothetical protein